MVYFPASYVMLDIFPANFGGTIKFIKKRQHTSEVQYKLRIPLLTIFFKHKNTKILEVSAFLLIFYKNFCYFFESFSSHKSIRCVCCPTDGNSALYNTFIYSIAAYIKYI